MPLEKRPVHVPFVAGVNTKAHPFVLDLPPLAVAQNLLFDEIGAVKKRPGHSPLVRPAVALLTAAGSDSTATSYATASISPKPNRLILVYVVSAIAAGTPAAPGLTGCSLTWVQIHTRQFNSNH